MEKILNILITTPLFPPEIDRIANYSKTLAERLASDHQVTILTYANHPVSANNYSLLFADKNKVFLQRFFSYLKLLHGIIAKQDIVILQSGVSAALPAFMISKLKGKKIIYRFLEDEVAKREKLGTSKIKLFFIRQAQRIILKYTSLIFCSNEEIQKTLIDEYQVSTSKLALILDPQEAKTILPFPRDIIEEKLSQNDYIAKILKRGDEENKTSWEKHIQKLYELFEK